MFRSTGAQAGAGWISFTTNRKKPQVKAQLTYYLPEKGGSHDFKFGFESLNDSYRYGHNGKSGPIRYSFAGSDASGSPDRILVGTGNGLLVTADGGVSWARATGEIANLEISQSYSFTNPLLIAYGRPLRCADGTPQPPC